MGARKGEGGASGALAPPPLEFEKMTSHAAVIRNTRNFSLAPMALAIDTLYFSLRRLKNAKIFVCAFGAPKNGQIFVGRAKNVSPLSVGGFAPFYGKHFCGRPWLH